MRLHPSRWHRLILLSLLLPLMLQAAQPQVSIERAALRLQDGIYYLDADFHLVLSPGMQQALDKGLVLALTVDFEVYRPRRLVWDETVASLSQRYLLRYHALTRRYQVLNLSTEEQSSYATLAAALGALSHIEGVPVIDEKLLAPDEPYIARVRVGIEATDLPVPLRIKSFFRSDWELWSPWMNLNLGRE